MTDVLALQSELVKSIAEEIRVQLTTQESVDPEVYENSLKGKAIPEFDRDPTYAPAWAGLGEALWTLTGTGFEFVQPAEVRDKAIAAADRALALDPNLPDAHKTRAFVALEGSGIL